MKLLILSFALLIAANSAFAETVSCPVGVLSATDDENENNLGEPVNLKINPVKDGLFAGSLEGEVEIKGMRVSGMLIKDNFVDIYSMGLILLNEKSDRIAADQFLLKYDGVSRGDGFDGEEGTDKLSILSGSLQQNPARFTLTYESFKILKNYGLQSRVSMNAHEILVATTKAIKAKKMKKGDIIGVAVLLLCNRTK